MLFIERALKRDEHRAVIARNGSANLPALRAQQRQRWIDLGTRRIFARYAMKGKFEPRSHIRAVPTPVVLRASRSTDSSAP
jgi:hypothetical protein